MKKKKTILIVLLVILVLVILSVVGYLVYQNIQFKKPIKQSWANDYYNYIKENTNKGQKIFPESAVDETIGFVQLENKQDPVLVTNYMTPKETHKTIIIYRKKNKKPTSNTTEEKNIKYMYNINLKEYRWYYYTKKDNDITYEDLIYTLEKEATQNDKTYTDDEIKTINDNYTNNIYSNKDTNKSIEQLVEVKDISPTFTKLDSYSDIKDLKTTIEKSATTYKTNDKLLTSKVKEAVQKEVSSIEEKKHQEQLEAMRLTQDNLQSKVGNNLKYFTGLYMGSTYGIYKLYKLNDVTGQVNVPGINSDYEMTYEVVGLSSINELNNLFKQYISDSVITSIKGDDDITKTLHDYNGKVYYGMGGIGDSENIDYSKAKLLSSEGTESQVELDQISPFTQEITYKVVVTITYDESSSTYKITNYKTTKLS